MYEISIHAPREGDDDPAAATAGPRQCISIHAPREGGDDGLNLHAQCAEEFQSTPPARGATRRLVLIAVAHKISIHAPREGGDSTTFLKDVFPFAHFNPRPPRGGRLRQEAEVPRLPVHFNPRPPRGGRPSERPASCSGSAYFNPRPPRGGRPVATNLKVQKGFRISIHAPREGGDFYPAQPHPLDQHFNPRPPRGGRRRVRSIINEHLNFNPRPPRGGRHLTTPRARGMIAHFNPRPPRGGRRRTWCASRPNSAPFQSTPPARGATAKMHSFTCGSLTNK